MRRTRTDEFRNDPARLTSDLFYVFVSRTIWPCLRSHLVSLQGLRGAKNPQLAENLDLSQRLWRVT
jgi:hypothetical protein